MSQVMLLAGVLMVIVGVWLMINMWVKVNGMLASGKFHTIDLGNKDWLMLAITLIGATLIVLS